MSYKDSGWIKLHRKMRDNPYMRKPAYRSVWIELIMEAEHGMKNVKGKWVKKKKEEMKSVIWNGKRRYLEAGQLTVGTAQLSEWTGVPRGTVVRILKTLKNEHQIEHQTSNKFSLITVNNWGEYQNSEQQNEQPVNNQWTTSEQPVNNQWTHHKELKNNKNIRTKELESVNAGAEAPTPAQIAKEFFTTEDHEELISYMTSKGFDKDVSREEVQKFILYWTEPNRSGKKERWEMQKTFEVKRRLVTWFSRIKQSQQFKQETKGFVIK